MHDRQIRSRPRFVEDVFTKAMLKETNTEQDRRIRDVGPLGEEMLFELVDRGEGERMITYLYRVTRGEDERPRNYWVCFEIGRDGNIRSLRIEE